MKMKKGLFFAAAAVALLASCSQSEEIASVISEKQNAPQAIEFGTYLSKQGSTRANNGYAGEIKTTDLQDAKDGTKTQGFGVYAFHTESNFNISSNTAPNFMVNEQVYYATDWKYDNIKYWPNGTDVANAATPSKTATDGGAQYLSFFAYAPYVSAGDAAKTGITAIPAKDNSEAKLNIGYKLAGTKISEVVDLLWGTRGKTPYKETDGSDNTGTVGSDYNVDLTKQPTTEKVEFLFKHALAKIGGKTAADKSFLKVVYDIDGNGSGAVGAGTTDPKTQVTVESISIKNADADGKSTFYETGKFDIASGTWSEQKVTTESSGGPSINISLTKDDINEAISTKASPSYSDGWTPLGVTTAVTDVYKSDATADAIVLIPGGTDQKLEVEVEYVVRTYDAKLDKVDDVTSTKVTQKIKNVVSLSGLEANKAYTLVIHLGLTSVKFSATVSDWEDGYGGSGSGNTQEIWLPSNVVPAS